MKKITFKTLSILLAAVLLVAAFHLATFAEEVSATSSCQHVFEATVSVTYTYESDTECLRTEKWVETCIECNFVNNYEVETYTSHNIGECYNTYYSSHSNEYHIATEYLEEICLCCGGIINSYEEYSSLECHEFDDTVDPEVDLEGVCILCGDEVSW